MAGLSSLQMLLSQKHWGCIMADFFALIMDTDYTAPKPLIPLHVSTQSGPDFSALVQVDHYVDCGTLYRPAFNFQLVSTQTVINTYSHQNEQADVFAVTHK
jgi:hypothetical protein